MLQAARQEVHVRVQEEARAAGALLREKGLLPADDSDDDVNYAEAAGVEW